MGAMILLFFFFRQERKNEHRFIKSREPTDELVAVPSANL
jgi:hypothetical protein